MTLRILLPSAVAAAIVSFGCVRPAPTPPHAADAAFTLAAEFVAPKPPANATGLDRLGGLSGLAALNAHEVLAVADDRIDSRVYRLRVNWDASRFSVTTIGVIALGGGPGAPATIDPEGIAVTRTGRIFVSSEGIGNEEPRLPPALVEYAMDGRFVRQLPLRPRYTPTPRGPIVSGVRDNAAFESLTISPDNTHLFTATELPLVQDGAAETFSAGARSRILEYVAADGAYAPAREFAYEIAPLEALPYVPRFAVNGLVELVSLGGDELLALERGFAESVDRSHSMNRIRVYRVSLSGATDVSSLDTLPAEGVVPVRKTLLLDVNKAGGLSPRLAALDNFEGLVLGPPGRRGIRPLLLVSDDNFSARQLTAFLLFGSH
jgi:hypothetical protein